MPGTLPLTQRRTPAQTQEQPLNNVIYIVGLVVVVLAVLSFFGLR